MKMELKVGKQVYHERFGIGTITEIDKGTVVQINFDGKEKRLMLEYANLSEPTQNQTKSHKNSLNEIEFLDHSQKQKSLNESDLKDLEKYFSFELPEHYQLFLQNFPKDVSNFKREYLVGNELLTERYLRNSVNSIIEVNKYFDAFELDNMIALGDDGCGNYYAIKSNSNDRKVYFINHEGYFDKQKNKVEGLTNENFDRLAEVEAETLEKFGDKLVKDNIEFYNSK